MSIYPNLDLGDLSIQAGHIAKLGTQLENVVLQYGHLGLERGLHLGRPKHRSQNQCFKHCSDRLPIADAVFRICHFQLPLLLDGAQLGGALLAPLFDIRELVPRARA